MLYSILIYGSESAVGAWAPGAEDDMLERHTDLRDDLQSQGRLGAVLRLMPDTATTVRHAGAAHPLVTDGPFAETKEQLMGIYIVDCDTLEQARDAARRLDFETGVFEIRPVTWYDPGVIPARIPQV
ncbi:YciI family protein [Variovorax paradoxus]|uniref:YCII-related protein n=1 Tax=Variovorax paradoxus (strain EPS) TaxID=595537 RepID=E6V713_VARPE|nr:YciI family protein [Variovorax paradoxus]ADU38309.1 YCII-related protein [Variovorax paradoxus EPS]